MVPPILHYFRYAHLPEEVARVATRARIRRWVYRKYLDRMRAHALTFEGVTRCASHF